MRRARNKNPLQSTCYHAYSRCTGGLFWLSDDAKSVFLDQLRDVAAFCGVQVLAYAILSNHFHLLIRVPAQATALELTDDQIVGRVETLYGADEAMELRDGLASANGAVRRAAEEERERFRLLMAEVSQFMKLLKQRFTQWYNGRHARYGTIWAERFTSDPIPDDPLDLQSVASYIDLNPVRAGICDDPLHYRYCSYAEAVATEGMARDGLVNLIAAAGRQQTWEELHATYRLLMFSRMAITADAEKIGQTAPAAGPGSKHGISEARCKQVNRAQGHLPAAMVKSHAARYLSHEIASGGPIFGSSFIQENKGRYDRDRRWVPEPRDRLTYAIESNS
jgi:putative transposase